MFPLARPISVKVFHLPIQKLFLCVSQIFSHKPKDHNFQYQAQNLITPFCVPTKIMPSNILPITNNSQIPKLKDIADNSDNPLRISISLDDTECESALAAKPFLSRANSFTSIVGPSFYQQRRRRVHSDNSLLSLSECGGREEWLGGRGDVEVDDRCSVSRCWVKVWGYVREGYKLVMRFLALGCYSLLIMPGVFQVAYNYYFSRQIQRDIIYGDQPRNKLDLYLPKNRDGPKPVVAFITGGAWIIGYKAWGSLLGQQLSERDVIVACIDYRNFPQATIGDMVKDASRGISFVCNNIVEYGGDPNRIYLMGQSAGAHIAACALVEQAIKEAAKEETASWSVSQIKTYFGLSGGYDLLSLYNHFHNRGLHRSIFLSIMEGEESLQRYSPDLMIKDPNTRNAVSLLPPILLFHGAADYSIPPDSSTKFADSLQELGVKAESILYEGKTHTDVFVQDPMRGGRDQLFEDLVTIIHAEDPEALAKDEVAPPRRRLVPELMLKLASRISPF